jgi:hypothetical protein
VVASKWRVKRGDSHHKLKKASGGQDMVGDENEQRWLSTLQGEVVQGT